jgi:hypothetical protein
MKVAAEDNYRFSTIVLGIISTPAFQMDRAPPAPATVTASTQTQSAVAGR